MARMRSSKKAGRRPGRPSRASTVLASLTTAQLLDEIDRRDGEVTELAARRGQLVAEVEALDAEIEALTGRSSPGGSKRRRRPAAPRRRPKNKTGLVEALHKVLRGRTMSVTEVATAVQKAGYKTSSDNFRVIVNQALINSKNKKLFKKVARGQYTAK